jgi:hypothetical protein
MAKRNTDRNTDNEVEVDGSETEVRAATEEARRIDVLKASADDIGKIDTSDKEKTGAGAEIVAHCLETNLRTNYEKERVDEGGAPADTRLIQFICAAVIAGKSVTRAVSEGFRLVEELDKKLAERETG